MGEISPSRYVVHAGWQDAPHLDDKTKRELLASTPPHLREARSKGIPSLGVGAVYPIALENVLCAPFAIPAFWRRCYGLDVGWNRTAAVWVAEDPTDGVLYAYAEYARDETLPIIHAEAIKARGEWIPGAIDPASRGRSQADGKDLFTEYQALGLNIVPGDNRVEGEDSGITKVWSLLELGRLRLFSTLQGVQAEYRSYHRNERGEIVKTNDHRLDALRYGVATFDRVAIIKPAPRTVSAPRGVADTRTGY